jgi:hypothetical protein
MNDTTDTSGFYKKEDDGFLYGKVVLNANYELRSESKDQYTYPVEGWYWFDTEEEAKRFFNLN